MKASQTQRSHVDWALSSLTSRSCLSNIASCVCRRDRLNPQQSQRQQPGDVACSRAIWNDIAAVLVSVFVYICVCVCVCVCLRVCVLVCVGLCIMSSCVIVCFTLPRRYLGYNGLTFLPTGLSNTLPSLQYLFVRFCRCIIEAMFY